MGLSAIASAWGGDLPGTEDGDWKRRWRWTLPGRTVDLWSVAWGSSPVRVTGDVPPAESAALWMLGQKVAVQTVRVAFGEPDPPRDPFTFPDASKRYVAEVTVDVGDRPVVYAMPTRGLRRRSRRIHVAIGADRYRLRARGWGMVQLDRPDGTPLWRVRFFRADLLADDATPTEVAVVALAHMADLPERVTLGWWQKV